jgi:hypothetical protein
MQTLQTEFRRRVWGTLEPRHFQSDLRNSCIFDERFGPYLPKEDEFHHVCSVIKDAEFERRTYLYHLRRPVFLEPEFGYVIAEPNAIVYPSLPGSDWARCRNTMQFFSGIPSLGKLSAARKGRLPVKKLPKVASLRFVFEGNYYHFFLDVMSKLKILDDYGIGSDVPLVISPQIAAQKFFQSFRERGNLVNRNWLVHDNFYIQAEEVLFAKADSGNRAPLDHF